MSPYAVLMTFMFILTFMYTDAKKPPGYVAPPKEYDPDPPNYEYGYKIQTEKGKQGKDEQRDGIYAQGRYYVEGTESSQNVKYFADDWGYHPVVEYSNKNPHGKSSATFVLGEEAIKLKNNQKQIPQDPSDPGKAVNLRKIDPSSQNQPTPSQHIIIENDPATLHPTESQLQLLQPQEDQQQTTDDILVQPQVEQQPGSIQPQEDPSFVKVLEPQVQLQSQPTGSDVPFLLNGDKFQSVTIAPLENPQQNVVQHEPQHQAVLKNPHLLITPNDALQQTIISQQPQLILLENQPQIINSNEAPQETRDIQPADQSDNVESLIRQPILQSPQQIALEKQPPTTDPNVALQPAVHLQPEQAPEIQQVVVLQPPEIVNQEQIIDPSEASQYVQNIQPEHKQFHEAPNNKQIVLQQPQQIFIDRNFEAQNHPQPLFYYIQQAHVIQPQLNLELLPQPQALIYSGDKIKQQLVEQPDNVVEQSKLHFPVDEQQVLIQNNGLDTIADSGKEFETAALIKTPNNIVSLQEVDNNEEFKEFGAKLSVPVTQASVNKLIDVTRNLVSGADVLNINEAVFNEQISGEEIETSTLQSLLNQFVTPALATALTNVDNSNVGVISSTTVATPVTEKSLFNEPIVAADSPSDDSEDIPVTEKTDENTDSFASTARSFLLKTNEAKSSSSEQVLVTPRPVSSKFLAPITAGIQLQQVEDLSEDYVEHRQKENVVIQVQKTIPYYLGMYEYPSAYAAQYSGSNDSLQDSKTIVEQRATEDIELGKTLLYFPEGETLKAEKIVQELPKKETSSKFTEITSNHLALQQLPLNEIKQNFSEIDQQALQEEQQFYVQEVPTYIQNFAEPSKLERKNYPANVPIDIAYPNVQKPVHITQFVERRVPIPQPYPVEKIVERPVHIPVEVTKYVDRPYPVEVRVPYPQPYPVEKVVHRVVKEPYPVEVKVPVHVGVPIPQPVSVEKIVEKKVPVPYYIEKPVDRIIEKQVPHYVDRPYPVGIPQAYLVHLPKVFTTDSGLVGHHGPEGNNYNYHPQKVNVQYSYVKTNQQQNLGHNQQNLGYYVNNPYAYAPQINQYLPPNRGSLPSGLKKLELLVFPRVNTGYLPPITKNPSDLQHSQSYQLSSYQNTGYLPPPSTHNNCDNGQIQSSASYRNVYLSVKKPDEHIGLVPPKRQPFEDTRKYRTARSNFDDKSVRMEYGFMPPLIPSLEIDEQGRPIEKDDNKN